MAQEEEPSSSSLDDIPTVRGLNLSMPAEWAPHRACLILYPHNPQTFRLGNYRAQGEAQLRNGNGNAQAQVLQVAHAICHQGHETVYLLATNDAQAQELRQTSIVLASEDKIQVYVCPSNDTWVRDTGPTCCWSTTATTTTTDTATTQLIGLDWEFNAYGGPEEGCYWPCDLDQQVARRVCHDLLQNIPCYKVPLILEGGSIHTDGEGTLLVTKECLLHPNRNPTRSQDDIDLILKHTLGVETVLWLPLGLDADDDTNGHVDNFCCFVKPGHVVLAWTDDQVHDMGNYQRCRQAESFLLSCQDAKGRSLQVHKLQLPPPLTYTIEEAQCLASAGDGDYALDRQAGDKMAASYVNFYIANQAVIVPQFGVASTDAQAIQTLQGLFPNRQVVGVPSREILMGGGNIHCITQQIPAEL